jgi:hypothetical protein
MARADAPAGSSDTGQPPEMAGVIASAQAEMERLIQLGELQHDPIRHPIRALAVHLDAQQRLFNDLQRTLDTRQPAAVFTDKQVDDVGRRLLGSCQAWSAGLVRASLWRSWAAMAAIVLAAVIVGGVASWLAFGQPLDTQCRDERGGRWCGYWLTQPTAK